MGNRQITKEEMAITIKIHFMLITLTYLLLRRYEKKYPGITEKVFTVIKKLGKPAALIILLLVAV